MSEDGLERALQEVKETHETFVAATERLTRLRNEYRDERDAAIRRAVEIGGPKVKKDVAELIGATPQWINRLLRLGKDAYRRQSD